MRASENRKLVTRVYAEVWNGRRLNAIDELFASDYQHNTAGRPDMLGRETYRAWVERYLTAVPDYHLTIEDIVADDDSALVRWWCRGTHAGELFGLPATGKPFTLTGMTLFRIRNGRIQASWVERDAVGLFRQLGVLPSGT